MKYVKQNSINTSFLVCLGLCLIQPIFAQQTVIDSLENILPKVRDDYESINIINEISFAYTSIFPDTAWKIAQKNYEKAQSLNYIKGMARAAYCKGSAFFYMGNYYLDIQNSLEALRLYESVNDKAGMANTCSGLGISYDAQGQNSLAIEYLERASSYAADIQDIRSMGVSSSNLANVYSKIGQPEKGLLLAQKAEKILRGLPSDMRAYDYTLNAICEAYLAMKDYNNALVYNKKHLEIAEEIKDPDNQIVALINAGKIYSGLEKYPQAEQSLEKAIQLAHQNQNEDGRKEGYFELAKMYEKIGNYPKSSYFFKKYSLIKDTLLDEANARNIVHLQAKYDIEKKDTENNLLKKQQALDKATLQIQFWLIVSISIFLLSGIIISFVFYKKQKEQEKLNNALSLQKIEIQSQNESIKEINQQLINQTEELAAINQVKNKLFAIIGHDLRSPINSLVSLLELVGTSTIDAKEFQELFPKLQRNVKNVQYALDNLLLWSNTQLSGITNSPEHIDIQRIVKEKIELLEDLAKQKHIELQSFIPEKTFVFADEHHTRIIFRNLINNAIKFTPEYGTVTISLEQDKDFLTISVKDTGIGMNKETLTRLFRKDAHFSTKGTNGEKGTGLGLLLCQEMVEKNKGKIWVESTLGQGSNFLFTLPKYLTN
jgi:signal transduction histidine kinase